jgi:hypothetical protein
MTTVTPASVSYIPAAPRQAPATSARGIMPAAADDAGHSRQRADIRSGTAPRTQALVSGDNALKAQESDCTEGPDGLTEEERAEVGELKARDREVRRHEQAHAAVGGRYAGSPSYTFEQGPDGNQYAVAGKVPIDTSPVANDPKATIDKMEIVHRAALAPAEPSGADRAVAAKAQQQAMQARQELAKGTAEDDPLAPEQPDGNSGSNRSGKLNAYDFVQSLVSAQETGRPASVVA